jgi:hypothetical protein
MKRTAVRLYASRVAADLRLPLGIDPIDGVLAATEERVRRLLRDFEASVGTCQSLSLLCDLVASSLRTQFEIVRSDAELTALRSRYLQHGESGFARLEADLAGDSYGVTIRLLHPEPWGMQFVSVIDCRGEKRHREFYTKWHELAHLLILTDQLRLVFRRTHEERSNPEEQLVDLIAGRCGFHRDIVARHASGDLDLQTLDLFREQLCPEASRQAATIGLVNAWPRPCVLVHAELALKADEERTIDGQSVAKLRATHVSVNDAARELGIALFRNMRVPSQSVITRVFDGDLDAASEVENLAWWEAGERHLDTLPIRVHARRTYGGVEALLIPLDAHEGSTRTEGRRRRSGAPRVIRSNRK